MRSFLVMQEPQGRFTINYPDGHPTIDTIVAKRKVEGWKPLYRVRIR